MRLAQHGPMRRGRFFVVLAIMSLSACGIIESRSSTIEPAYLVLGGQEAEVEVPESAELGSTFTISVASLGSAGCVEPAESSVLAESGSITVRVHDEFFSGGCPFVLDMIGRDIRLVAHERGRVVISIIGRNLNSDPYVMTREIAVF